MIVKELLFYGTGSYFGECFSECDLFFATLFFILFFADALWDGGSFIVGQFDGVASTTAVSIGSQVMHMLTVMIVGLAMGRTVSIGQSIGAGDKKRLLYLWEIR